MSGVWIAVLFSVAASSILDPTAAHAQAAEIARYEKWRGGDAFLAMSTVHKKGTLTTAGLSGSIETWTTREGRTRQKVDLGAVKQDMAVDTSDAWSSNLSAQTKSLSPEERRDAAHDATFLFANLFHGTNGVVVSARPSEVRVGKTWDVVRAQYGTAASYDFLINREDGHLLGVRTTSASGSTFTQFGDWRISGGVLMPYREEVTGDTPADASTSIYSSIDVNPAVPKGVFARPATARHVSFAPGASSSGWLPFEFYDRTRIFVRTSVNGRVVPVLLDSGAESTVLDRHFAAALRLRGQGAVTAQGAGGAAAAAILQGVDIQLGGMRLRNVTAAAIDLSQVARQIGHPLPVILGAEVFEGAIVDIDFSRKRIAFRDATGFVAPEGAVILPTGNADGIHTVQATIEGQPATLEVDLGNGGPLMLYPRFWDRPAFLDRHRLSTTMGGAVGGMSEEGLAVVSSLSLGDTVFTSIPTSLAPDRSAAARARRVDGNVGLPVLSRFRLVVDFAQERLILEPPVDKAPFDIDRSGLFVRREGNGLRVLHVAATSPATIAGIEVGAMIVAVDGLSIAERRTKGLTDWRTGPPGTSVRVRLEDGRTRTIVLRPYF